MCIDKMNNREGNTPLHLAAADGNESAISLLIESGAKLDEMNTEEQTPVDTVPEHLFKLRQKFQQAKDQ